MDEVFKLIENALKDPFPEKSPGKLLVAIDGNSGSGKSQLSEKLKAHFDCNVFHTDDFFLPCALRKPERFAETGGNVHYERLLDLLKAILKGQVFTYDIYDCSTDSFYASQPVCPKYLNIVEGVYSLHDCLEDFYDLKVFLSVEQTEKERRILKRNGEGMLKRFQQEWFPLEDTYFEKAKIQSRCDLVVDTTKIDQRI